MANFTLHLLAHAPDHPQDERGRPRGTGRSASGRSARARCSSSRLWKPPGAAPGGEDPGVVRGQGSIHPDFAVTSGGAILVRGCVGDDYALAVVKPDDVDAVEVVASINAG